MSDIGTESINATLSEIDSGHMRYPALEKQIGKGNTRTVYEHPEDPIVIKHFHDNSIEGEAATSTNYTALDLSKLVDQVSNDKKELERIQVGLIALGSDGNTIPDSDFVIHQSQAGGLTFSEVQPKIEGNTLENNKFQIMRLPKETLEELLHLFELDLQLISKGESLDIIGSTNGQHSKISKAVRRLMPLFFATNIMIDDKQHVKYIDPKIFSKEYYNHSGPTAGIKQLVSRIGSATSVMMLKGLLAFKK